MEILFMYVIGMVVILWKWRSIEKYLFWSILFVERWWIFSFSLFNSIAQPRKKKQNLNQLNWI